VTLHCLYAQPASLLLASYCGTPLRFCYKLSQMDSADGPVENLDTLTFLQQLIKRRRCFAEARRGEQADTATVATAAAADEASADGEASSGRGKRAQRSRRPTLAVLEAGDLSDTDAAIQPEPAEGAADEEDLQDYEPDGVTAAPTSPPPSAKRKRSRMRQAPAAAGDEAGLPEAALGSGPDTTASSTLLGQPEDALDAGTAAPEPSQAQPSWLAEASPSSAKGQRTRARQPPAKFQPTFSPDRPAAKRASKAAAASVAKAELPAAAGKPSGASSRARRGKGASQPADQPVPDGAGVADDDAAAANGNSAPASGAGASATTDAAVQPAVTALLKRGDRSKQGSGVAGAKAPSRRVYLS